MLEIQKLTDALRGPVHVRGSQGREFVALPEGYNLEEMPLKPPTPPIESRIIAARRFADGDSLVAYVKRYAGEDSLLLADIRSGNVEVLLDYHTGEGEPAAVDHTATWTLEHSQEFAAWSEVEGRKLSDQETFIRFLEENAADIVSPDAAVMLDICRDFDATRNVQFKQSQRLDNGDRKLMYVTETNTKEGITIPQKFTIRIPIYYGEQPLDLTCLFRWRIGDGKLNLGFEFHRARPVIDAAFRAAAFRVAEESGLQAMFGR